LCIWKNSVICRSRLPRRAARPSRDEPFIARASRLALKSPPSSKTGLSRSGISCSTSPSRRGGLLSLMLGRRKICMRCSGCSADEDFVDLRRSDLDSGETLEVGALCVLSVSVSDLVCRCGLGHVSFNSLRQAWSATSWCNVRLCGNALCDLLVQASNGSRQKRCRVQTADAEADFTGAPNTDGSTR
jgi:hypothetical protein